MNFQRNKNLVTSFVIDWVIILILIVVYFVINKIKPFERQFRLDDDTIGHPYSESETISTMQLAIINACLCLAVILGYHLFKKDLKYNLHQALLGLCLSVTLTILLTTILKVSVGRYRPDFLGRCQVDFSKVEEQYRQNNITYELNYSPTMLFNTSICLNEDEHVMNDGRKSFPSGHSSNIFSGMTYISLFIAGKTKLLDKRGYIWKMVLTLAPLFFATYVAATRVFDYRHHWQDVLVGSLIGIVFATLSYFYYFPSFSNVKADYPYQIRLSNDEEEKNSSLPLYNVHEENIEVN